MLCIKVAKYDDLEEVNHLFKQAVDEVGTDYGDFDAAVALDTLRHDYYVAPCFLVVDGDSIVGFASLALHATPWNRKPSLTSNMVFVLKEHRSFAIMKKLYKAIRDYADLQGLIYADKFIGTERDDAMVRLARIGKLKNNGISIYYNGASK